MTLITTGVKTMDFFTVCSTTAKMNEQACAKFDDNLTENHDSDDLLFKPCHSVTQ